MKSHIVLVSLGLSIFYLSGCTPAGKSYWLTYKADPKVAPASIYYGYYDIGSNDLIEACLGEKEEHPKFEGKRSSETDGDFENRLKKYYTDFGRYNDRQDQYKAQKGTSQCPKAKEAKPSLKDHDQANVVVYTTTPGEQPLNELECHITQTKMVIRAKRNQRSTVRRA